MGRKNSRVRRSNDRGRRNRKKLEELGVARGQRTTIPLEDIVMPDGRCNFVAKRKPKVRFSDEDKARRALAQAQQKRLDTGSSHTEKSVFRCPPGGCGGWHLSSREEFDEELWQGRRELFAAKREAEGR